MQQTYNYHADTIYKHLGYYDLMLSSLIHCFLLVSRLLHFNYIMSGFLYCNYYISVSLPLCSIIYFIYSYTWNFTMWFSVYLFKIYCYRKELHSHTDINLFICLNLKKNNANSSVRYLLFSKQTWSLYCLNSFIFLAFYFLFHFHVEPPRWCAFLHSRNLK